MLSDHNKIKLKINEHKISNIWKYREIKQYISK